MPTEQERAAALHDMAAANPFPRPQPPGQAEPPPASEPPSQVAPPMPPMDAHAGYVWLRPDEHAENQRRAKLMEEQLLEYRREADKREAERIKLMAEKGQLDQAFQLLRERHDKEINEERTLRQQREQAWLGEKVRQAISEAMAGRHFTGADPTKTAGMVARMLELEVEAIIGPTGAPVVRHKLSLEPAEGYLKRRLDDPTAEFAVCLAARKPEGGSGTDGSRPPAAPQQTQAPTPTRQPTLTAEESVKRWQSAEQPIIPGFGFGARPRTG